MTFPNFANKHAYDAFFTPQDWLTYFRKHHLLPDTEMPQGVIFCYQNSLLRHIAASEETEKTHWAQADVYLLGATQKKVAVCGGFGFGAPAAATLLEGLIVLGIKKFISIGTAGGLQKSLQIGDIVVCNKAIRDEGVSYHYLEATKYVEPSQTLTARLKDELEKLNIGYVEGTTWTIDAPFRETVAEAQHYQSEGVLTVEMEAAALCAVARYRQVDLATAFAISDSLADLEWKPAFARGELSEGLANLYKVAHAALL